MHASMHRILTAPLRDYHHASPGPVEIRFGRGHVAILAGGKLVALQGGASGSWPSPVTLDASELDKLRHGREVRRIEISYIDGELHVEVAEYVPEPRYRRQPCLPFDQALPLMPRPPVALPASRVAGQMALAFGKVGL
jgi:hypothetical protein